MSQTMIEILGRAFYISLHSHLHIHDTGSLHIPNVVEVWGKMLLHSILLLLF